MALAANAFSVLLSDPFTLILHLCLTAGAGLIACLPAFAFSEHLRLLRDQTLALTFLGGALAATLGAAKTVGEEGRKGMTPLIMSRPVSPGAYLCGKWLGLAAALFLLSASATAAYLWASRIAHFNHNIERLGLVALAISIALPLAGAGLNHFLHRGCFVRQANFALAGTLLVGLLIVNCWGYNGGVQAQFGTLPDWPTSLAYLYLYLALLTYSAILVAVAVSADLSVLMGVSAVVFFVGLLAEYLISTFIPNPAIGGIFRVFIPNWQLFWIAERLADAGPPPLSHFLSAATHAVGQALLFLLAGQAWLRRRELTGGI
jgi:ABC-type Na+ efflux pump permease subunit